MKKSHWKQHIQSFDNRRDIIIPGATEQTIHFCVNHFLEIAEESIQKRGIFIVALSGGQTPHAIFKELSQPSYEKALDWSKVLCFWSDERSVPPTDQENNYANAMKAGLANLPIYSENIFRMHAEENIEENAMAYEQLIQEKVPSFQFDLIMLGMGEDGHTASLFPLTHGLHTKDRLVIANYVPQKQTWRMSMTYECIHMARHICIYVLGANKAKTIAQIFLGPYEPDQFPIQRIGTSTHKALWIMDKEASSQLKQLI